VALFEVDLVTFSLHHNRLRHLDPAIGKMESLEELYLSHNELEMLPEALCECRELEVLTLSHNRLRLLPPLTGLVKLAVLTLQSNPLEAGPIVQNGMLWVSLPPSLRAQQQQEQQHRRERDSADADDSDGLDPVLYPNTPI